jgi:transcriptional regulator with XRE-family HTH domain
VSIRSVFARNLRALCAERGLSINAACKGIGIARSQMDRYLAGANLPNDRNLRRMSAFFAVDDTVFFATDRSPRSDTRPDVAALWRSDFDTLLERPSAIADGNYYTFFNEPLDPSRVMMSLTLVRRRGNATVFRRLTRYPGGATLRAGPLYRGAHRGVVVDRLNAHYFLGINRVGAREPSASVLRPMPFGEGLLRGQALIMTDEMPMVLAVVMCPVPAAVGLRRVIGQIGSVDFNAPIVDPRVRRLLRHAAP